MNARKGHALVWILIAIVVFGALLAAVLGASTTSRQGLVTRQRALERTLEAHRLARWAAALPEGDLLKLPRALGTDAGALDERVAAQLALGGEAPGALTAVRAALAIEVNAQGRKHLHRVMVRLTARDGSKIDVSRMVVFR